MGEIVTNPDPQPISVSTAWTPLLDRDTMSFFGMNKVTLTNWDTGTVLPEIAQGSALDIDGSVGRFITVEAIGGAPVNGVVYVKFIVAGDTVTAELTATAPVWDNTKGGWYNGSGERYSGHLMTKDGTSYTNKGRYRDESDGDQLIIEANRGIDTNNIDASTAVLGPTTVNGQITVNGEVQGTSLDINGAGNISSSLVVTGGVNTDNTIMKWKKFSGSLNSSGDASFNHGLTASKIISMSVALSADGTTWYTWWDTNPSQTQYRTLTTFNNTQIVIDAAINLFPSGAYRVVMFYEA